MSTSVLNPTAAHKHYSSHYTPYHPRHLDIEMQDMPDRHSMDTQTLPSFQHSHDHVDIQPQRRASFDGVLHTEKQDDSDLERKEFHQHDSALPPITTDDPRNNISIGVDLGREDDSSNGEVRITIPPKSVLKDEVLEDVPLGEQVQPSRTSVQTGVQALNSQPRPDHVIEIVEDHPQQLPENREREPKASCFSVVKHGLASFFHWLNPVRACREAREERRIKQERKAARKQREAAEKQRATEREQAVTSYFGAIRGLVGKVLGKEAQLTVLPDTLRREEEERLLNAYAPMNNRLPILKREADITASGDAYHVEVIEKRKADPNQFTKLDYMFPTSKPPYVRKDVREIEPDSSYPNDTVLTFKLTGPQQEKLTYDLHPSPEILCATIDYTERGGNKPPHHRVYSKLKNSLASSDFRSGDRMMLSLTKGVQSAMNHTEVKSLIDRLVDEHENQQRLKTRLDEAVTYKQPPIGEGNRKLSKAQKKALTDYRQAFSLRKQNIEDLVQQTVSANAEAVKAQQLHRRESALEETRKTLKAKFEALVIALNTEPPQLVLPEEPVTGCWPHRH